jgi:hypothetical protein
MKIGETILFSVVTGLAVALILSATYKKEPEYERPSIIIEEVE